MRNQLQVFVYICMYIYIPASLYIYVCVIQIKSWALGSRNVKVVRKEEVSKTNSWSERIKAINSFEPEEIHLTL